MNQPPTVGIAGLGRMGHPIAANILSGVSGITAYSPAMSAGGGQVVFSAYEDDSYNVYALDTPQALAGGPLVDLAAASSI